MHATVSLVIPMKDEALALPALSRVLADLGGAIAPRRRFRIVLVDDGSTDGTAAVVRELAGSWGHEVRLLVHATNRGIGAALRTASSALGDSAAVVCYDADLPYPPADIERLLIALDEGATVATASPWHPDGRHEDLGANRTLPSQAASLLYRLRFGRSDLFTWTCGFRAWRTATWLDCLPRENGFTATAEMLVRAVRRGELIAEVPSALRERTEGVSKLRLWPTTRRHLGLLARGPRGHAQPSPADSETRFERA